MTAIGATFDRPIDTSRGRSLPAIARRSLPRPSGVALLTGIAFGAYLAVAALLVFGMHSIEGDAWSRVGNAYYILFSRDPHLAAIGFVWNPLPSLAIAPLLLFKGLWPALVAQGFAANIVSALCMAGAVHQVRATLLELGVAPLTAVGLTVLFALHPMVLLYGANGMSEAMFVLFALVAVRHLVHWARSGQSAALAHCGIALALLYLTRYEGAALAAAAVAFVMARAFVRTGGLERRVAAATADALIVATPFAFALGVFAMTSWLIVGSPFETFTSVYGNSSQMSLSADDIRAATGQGTPAATGYVLRQLFGLEPAVAIAVIAAALAIVRHRPEVLAVACVLGAGVIFSVWSFTAGKTFGWLRFYILVVPLATLAGGAILAVRTRAAANWRRRAARGVATMSVLAAMVAGFPSTVATMNDAKLGREETDQIKWLLGSTAPRTGLTSLRLAEQMTGLDLAGYLDAMSLPQGSVLIDVATGFPVVLQSRRPEQFVITTDRDFEAAVADPSAFGVRYVIVGDPVLYGSVNAIERAHPGIYRDGAGIAIFVADFGSGADAWRLEQIVGAPDATPAGWSGPPMVSVTG